MEYYYELLVEENKKSNNNINQEKLYEYVYKLLSIISTEKGIFKKYLIQILLGFNILINCSDSDIQQFIANKLSLQTEDQENQQIEKKINQNITNTFAVKFLFNVINNNKQLKHNKQQGQNQDQNNEQDFNSQNDSNQNLTCEICNKNILENLAISLKIDQFDQQLKEAGIFGQKKWDQHIQILNSNIDKDLKQIQEKLINKVEEYKDEYRKQIKIEYDQEIKQFQKEINQIKERLKDKHQEKTHIEKQFEVLEQYKDQLMINIKKFQQDYETIDSENKQLKFMIYTQDNDLEEKSDIISVLQQKLNTTQKDFQEQKTLSQISGQLKKVGNRAKVQANYQKTIKQQKEDKIKRETQLLNSVSQNIKIQYTDDELRKMNINTLNISQINQSLILKQNPFKQQANQIQFSQKLDIQVQSLNDISNLSDQSPSYKESAQLVNQNQNNLLVSKIVHFQK